MGLGDTIERALTLLGITQSRITHWIGRPCGCEERKQKLNSLGYWAKRVISGKTDRHVDRLDAMMDEVVDTSVRDWDGGPSVSAK